MPIIVNKVGAHRNEDALSRVVYYMMTSNYFKTGNCRGVWEYSPLGIVNGFEFVKEMYGKSDGKQVSHLVIGAGLSVWERVAMLLRSSQRLW